MDEYLMDFKGQHICIVAISPYCKCYRCRNYKEKTLRKTEQKKLKRQPNHRKATKK